MKKIVLACGAGVATSTAVENKITALLDKNGYAGQYTIVQCAISEAVDECQDADLLISTTVAPSTITCAFVSGVPFLTSVGLPAAQKQVLEVMAQ